MAVDYPIIANTRFKDFSGARLGRLTVIELAGMSDGGFPIWRCRCECGETFVATTQGIYRRKSCGCLARESRRANRSAVTHDMSRTVEYRAWVSMKARCLKPSNQSYDNYGGRGITICDRWLGPDGFTNFIADLGRKPSPRHSIHRNDNDGPYCPENCCWATAKEQARNRRLRRTRKRYNVNGMPMFLADIAAMAGIAKSTAYARLRSGWTPEDVVKTPLKRC